MSTVAIHTVSPDIRKQGMLNIGLLIEIMDNGHIHRLSGGHIRQSREDIYWFNKPSGYHVSYHDADAANPEGRIHVRIGPKGMFRVFPGNEEIGKQASYWSAPAFADIPGIQPIPPQDMGATMKSALLMSLDPSHIPKRSEADYVLHIRFVEEAKALLGPSLVAVLPDSESILRQWCETQRTIWEKDGLSEISAWIFDTFNPSLAVVAGCLLLS